MDLYLLIHEKKADTDCHCDVNIYRDRDAAQSAMRADWEKAVKTREFGNGVVECSCGSCLAVIHDGKDYEAWRVEERYLDVSIAVLVEGGMIQEAVANAAVSMEVYDLDVQDRREDDEDAEPRDKQAEFDELSKKPGWCSIW